MFSYLSKPDREFRVFVRKHWNGEDERQCVWLGHDRYMCGKCRKGYFDVDADERHPISCGECHYMIFTRSSGPFFR